MTDEITIFREGRPAVPPYDPAAKARVRALLLTETKASPQRGRAVLGQWRLVAVVAATAMVAGGIAYVKDTGGTWKPPVAVRPTRTADDAAVPGPHQWAHLKFVYATTAKGGGGAQGPLDRRITNDRWERVDGRQTALLSGGRLQISPMTPESQTPTPPTYWVLVHADYAHVYSLPTDPAALLRTLRAMPMSGPGSQDLELFRTISTVMTLFYLPPGRRLAWAGALRLIPHVTVSSTTGDMLGRHGMTLSLTDGPVRNETMIDPATGDYLGSRIIAIEDHSPDRVYPGNLTKGQILGWSARLSAKIVNQPGQQ
jgi:hypothetical protein